MASARPHWHRSRFKLRPWCLLSCLPSLQALDLLNWHALAGTGDHDGPGTAAATVDHAPPARVGIFVTQTVTAHGRSQGQCHAAPLMLPIRCQWSGCRRPAAAHGRSQGQQHCDTPCLPVTLVAFSWTLSSGPCRDHAQHPFLVNQPSQDPCPQCR